MDPEFGKFKAGSGSGIYHSGIRNTDFYSLANISKGKKYDLRKGGWKNMIFNVIYRSLSEPKQNSLNSGPA